MNGKPAYLEGKPIDGRADLFALGTVMMHGATAADMARGLDDFVVGSQQRPDKVTAFVPEIEAISPLTNDISGERSTRESPGCDAGAAGKS